MRSLISTYSSKLSRLAVCFIAAILLFGVSLQPGTAQAYENSSIDIDDFFPSYDHQYMNIDRYDTPIRFRQSSTSKASCGSITLNANSTHIYFHVIGIQNNVDAFKNKWRYASNNPQHIDDIEYSAILAFATTEDDSWRNYFFYQESVPQNYQPASSTDAQPVIGWYFIPYNSQSNNMCPYVCSREISQIDDSASSPTYGQYYGAPASYNMATPIFNYDCFAAAQLGIPSEIWRYNTQNQNAYYNPSSSFNVNTPTLWLGVDSSKIYFDVL